MIVTGAGQGIGLAIAERFADEGADVMLIGRRLEPLEALVAAIGKRGGRAWLHQADVSDSAAVDAAVAAAHERWGRIDVLVNNAGIAEEKEFLEIEDASWDVILATNLRGAFLMSQLELCRSVGDARPPVMTGVVALGSGVTLEVYFRAYIVSNDLC